MPIYKKFGKRALDLAGGIAGLLIFGPAMVVVAVLVRANLGSPVLFRQLRPGKDGRPFTLLKFRTMKNIRDGQGGLLPDSQRLTSLGRLLRAFSLDELPQFWNLLLGDMSLVGPRPLLMEYLSRYTPEQARRHLVRPGITGWAQVNGRNAIRWEEKFALDIWYVENLSFPLDCRILWMTCLNVIRRSGISSHGNATMPEFMGSNLET